MRALFHNSLGRFGVVSLSGFLSSIFNTLLRRIINSGIDCILRRCILLRRTFRSVLFRRLACLYLALLVAIITSRIAIVIVAVSQGRHLGYIGLFIAS